MNLKILGILLGIIQLLLAIWYFNWNSWNHIIVSILLFLGAMNVFLGNPQSRFLIQTKRLIHIVVLAIVTLLVIKLLFVG